MKALQRLLVSNDDRAVQQDYDMATLQWGKQSIIYIISLSRMFHTYVDNLSDFPLRRELNRRLSCHAAFIFLSPKIPSSHLCVCLAFSLLLFCMYTASILPKPLKGDCYFFLLNDFFKFVVRWILGCRYPPSSSSSPGPKTMGGNLERFFSSSSWELGNVESSSNRLIGYP